MKTCPSCGLTKIVSEFGKDRRKTDGLNTYCKPCINAKAADYRKRYEAEHPGETYSEYQMKFRKSTPEREANWKKSRRKTHLKATYNLTDEEWEAMYRRQNGKCEICTKPFKNSKDTHTDHDHVTGEVRGLLCQKCNDMLGKCDESFFILSQAISYLRRYSTRKAM